MFILYLSVLTASLLGSLHCVGMCGGFVAFYAGGDVSEGRQQWLAHLAYSGGRWLAYVLLGVAVGSVGAAFDLAGRTAGMQRSAAVIAGAVMIVWGLAMLAVQRREVLGWQPKLPLFWQRWLMTFHRNLQQKPPTTRAILLGMMSGVLPCGWLYAFVLTAAATANPLQGALVMTAFWAGTLPAMLGLGVSIQWLGQRLRRHLPTLSAVSILVIGFVTLWQRATVTVMMPARAAVQQAKKQSATQRLKAIQMKKKKGHCACSHKRVKKAKQAKKARTSKSP